MIKNITRSGYVTAKKENGYIVNFQLSESELQSLYEQVESQISEQEEFDRIALENASDEQALKFIGMYEEWKGGILYAKDKRLRYRDEDGIMRLYKVQQDHESQDHQPPSINTASLYLMISPPEEEGKILPWEDRHAMGKELYMLNHKVIHRGFVWRSLIDLNSFEPKDENWSAWEKLEEVEDGSS